MLLSGQTIELLLTDPFFGHLLSALPRQASAAVADAALGVAEGRMILLVNEGWAAENSADQLGVLRHELLHLVFMHPWELQQAAFPWLFHLAADIMVGRENGEPALHLPSAAGRRASESGAVSLKEYGVWAIYHSLEQSWRTALDAGEALPWSWTADWQAVDSPLAKHRFWRPAVPEAELAPAAAQAAGLVRQAALRAGEAVPQGLRLWLDGTQGSVANVDWRRQLRLFSAGSRRTRLCNTIRRPSRRYGTAPGLRLERGARLLVAIDTSASVGAEALERFFEEIHQLWRQQRADIRIVECDAVIRKTYDYRGQRPEFVTGRGGTLFDAPIEYANHEDHPDGVIYFTDGEGPPPQTPCRYPLLWVISGERGGHLPGRRIMIQN